MQSGSRDYSARQMEENHGNLVKILHKYMSTHRTIEFHSKCTLLWSKLYILVGTCEILKLKY
jgi:hypothetical protein